MCVTLAVWWNRAIWSNMYFTAVILKRAMCLTEGNWHLQQACKKLKCWRSRSPRQHWEVKSQAPAQVEFSCSFSPSGHSQTWPCTSNLASSVITMNSNACLASLKSVTPTSGCWDLVPKPLSIGVRHRPQHGVLPTSSGAAVFVSWRALVSQLVTKIMVSGGQWTALESSSITVQCATFLPTIIFKSAGDNSLVVKPLPS